MPPPGPGERSAEAGEPHKRTVLGAAAGAGPTSRKRRSTNRHRGSLTARPGG